MSEVHALIRTSPKGERFIGTCMKCGVSGLTIKDMGSPCENVAGMSDEDALLEALKDEERDQ